MFKKSKRLIGLCLGVVLSLGVGVGLGNTHGEAVGVRAATLQTEVKYTDFSGGTSGSGSKIESTISPFTITLSLGYRDTSKSYTQSYGSGTIAFIGDTTVSKITSIVITASSTSYTGAQSTGSWSVSSGGGSVSVNSTTITYTGTSTTTNSVTLSSSKQLRWTKMVISYEEASITQATGLTITSSSTSVHAGEELTLTTALTGGSGAYEKTISWTSSDASVIAAPTNSEEGTEVTLTALSVGTTTLTGTVVSPGSATASVEIEVKAARMQTDISIHGTIAKNTYVVGDSWDLTGLDLKVTWSEGDPTYIDFSDDEVMYELTPKTATDTSITSFEIYVLYGDFEKTFTVNGITVTEKPIVDVLTTASTSLNVGTGSGYQTVSSRSKSNATDITSNATWAGKAYTNATDGPLQLNSTSGSIYTTSSNDQKVSSISVSFYNANSKTLKVNGSNKAYSSTTSSGTQLGSLTADGTITVSGSYRYIQIYTTGVMNITSISVTWVSYTNQEEAIEYAQYFNSNIGCDSTGATAPTGWSKVKTQWSKLTTAGQTYLKNVDTSTETDTDILNCIKTYEYIVNKYNPKSSTTYNDFMGRGIVSANASNAIYRTTDNNTAILIVVLVAFTSVTAIGGYFFIRKRRFN